MIYDDLMTKITRYGKMNINKSDGRN